MKKIIDLKTKVTTKLAPVTLTASIVATNATMAFADGDASGLMTAILEIVGKLIIILGLILAVMGIINYASAHSEGDGPAQNKAIGKIAAGVMLVGLSAILISMSSELVGYIQ